ncbi:TPA: hypothetical protein N0F65_009569 [Lagenidium giganteum]|uniref:Retrovirus-related Pol polyprotein from transposon TNT 1-94-like beta-barrel domain-containing protein n=1 Tax=Lagenidium giganteum TaxID=4803 RepID=A0AAV2YMF5_9STRA|nr:TPA: hypothetical protein N0F65_009569 [Lagenidium giganteum]
MLEWRAADLTALAVIVRLLSPQYKMMVRNATTAKEARKTLEAVFVKRTLHKRIQLRKQVHEFKMSNGDDIMAQYDAIVKIIENKKGVGLMEVKEMLRRECERMKKRESSEMALRASQRGRQKTPQRQQREQGRRGGRSQQQREGRVQFRGRCYKCNVVVHKERDFPQNNEKEEVFLATNEATTDWLVDSRATSHITFDRADFVSATMHAVGSGSVTFRSVKGKRVTLTKVLHVPNLARRLVSVLALTNKGLDVQFRRNDCVTTFGGETWMQAARAGKLYVMGAETALRAEPLPASNVVNSDCEAGTDAAEL